MELRGHKPKISPTGKYILVLWDETTQTYRFVSFGLNKEDNTLSGINKKISEIMGHLNCGQYRSPVASFVVAEEDWSPSDILSEFDIHQQYLEYQIQSAEINLALTKAKMEAFNNTRDKS